MLACELAVDAGKMPCKEPDEQGTGQADDVQIVAVDPLDETGAETLDRVGAGSPLPLACCQIALDVGGAERAEGDGRRLGVQLLPVGGAEAETRDDLVCPAAERL